VATETVFPLPVTKKDRDEKEEEKIEILGGGGGKGSLSGQKTRTNPPVCPNGERNGEKHPQE